MAETTADVRRDIELTRERMSSTLAQLEQKFNLMQVVRDHPWPALAVAVGAGIALSGSSADVKAAAATLTATKGASSKVGGVLDEFVGNLMGGLHGVLQERVDGWVTELKNAIGARSNGAHVRPSAGAISTAATGYGVRAGIDESRSGSESTTRGD